MYAYQVEWYVSIMLQSKLWSKQIYWSLIIIHEIKIGCEIVYEYISNREADVK